MKSFFTLLLFVVLSSFLTAQFEVQTPIVNQGDFLITDTVYMAVHGDDSNPGTYDLPVKTLTKAIDKLPWGVAGINGGHAYGLVMLHPGKYENVGSFQQTEGRWKNGNTYKNVSVEGIGEVTIGGAPDVFSNNHVLQLRGSHVFVKNINIRFANGIGLLISNSAQPDNTLQNNVLIEDVHVDSVGSFGMLLSQVETILINRSSSLYASRPGNEETASPCGWPSGIKFFKSKHASIIDSEVAYTRGEGLNFQNTTYGQAYNNRLHDNGGTNFYNDNSSRLLIHNNYIYNNPNLGTQFWGTCPADEVGVRMSPNAFLIANEGGGCGEGYITSYENCNTVCTQILGGKIFRYPHVDSMYIYNNIIQNVGRVFGFWDGITSTGITGDNINCIRNVFIFNNTAAGLLGNPEVNKPYMINFAFPDYNVLADNTYAKLKNVEIKKNIMFFDTLTYPNGALVHVEFNSNNPHPLEFVFNENLLNKDHSYTGTDDQIRLELPISVPNLAVDLTPIVPNDDNPFFTFKTEKEFSFLIDDYANSIRNELTNVGALEWQEDEEPPVGIAESITKNEFSIYPNPCYNCNELNFKGLNENKVNFQIYSQEGRLIYKGNNLKGNSIVVNNISDGMYLVSVFLKREIITKKWIVRKN